jgi:hypothetical protein
MYANFLSSSSIFKNVPYSLELALTLKSFNDAVTNLRLFVWTSFIILLVHINNTAFGSGPFLPSLALPRVPTELKSLHILSTWKQKTKSISETWFLYKKKLESWPESK